MFKHYGLGSEDFLHPIPPPPPHVLEQTKWLLEWLRTQIGKSIKVEFQVGTNLIQDKQGVLLDVSMTYILLRASDTNDIVACDAQSIKFITVYS